MHIQCTCIYVTAHFRYWVFLGVFFPHEMGYLLLWFDYYRNSLLLQMYLEFSKIREWIICLIEIYSSDSFFKKNPV